MEAVSGFVASSPTLVLGAVAVLAVVLVVLLYQLMYYEGRADGMCGRRDPRAAAEAGALATVNGGDESY